MLGEMGLSFVISAAATYGLDRLRDNRPQLAFILGALYFGGLVMGTFGGVMELVTQGNSELLTKVGPALVAYGLTMAARHRDW